MAIRPSIIISCGSSAAEVVSLLHMRFRNIVEREKVSKDLVQFLMIDSDAPPPLAAAGGLVADGGFVSISEPNSVALVLQMIADDPFFSQWWYPEFRNVGPMYPGMGTVPIKGRLGFWTNLGDPNAPQSFENMMEAMLRRARYVFGPAMQDQAAGVVGVYIISTVAGGTGAGIYLDIAHILRSMQGAGAIEINGVLMLPSIPNLKASSDMKQQIRANGYASLLALDMWQKQGGPPEWLDPYMTRGQYELRVQTSPFDLCYLFCVSNETGNNLAIWPDYARLIADGLACEIMTETAEDSLARKNDFVQTISGRGQLQGSPCTYASFAVAGICFNHDKVSRYLAHRYSEEGLGLALGSSAPGSTVRLAREFTKKQGIRERSADATKPVDEVIEKLNKAHPDYTVYADLPIEQRLMGLRVGRGQLRTSVSELIREQNARLEGHVEGLAGIPLSRLYQENRKRWIRHIVYGDPIEDVTLAEMELGQQPDDRVCLVDQLVDLIQREANGVPLALEFLERLQGEMEAHRTSIEKELNDNDDIGYKGERTRLGERMERLDEEVAVLSKGMFGPLKFIHKDDAIREFVTRLWRPWLRLRKRVMVKDEVIKFYTDLENAIGKFKQVLAVLRSGLESARKDLGKETADVLGQHWEDESYVLDEPVLEDPEHVDSIWLNQDASKDVRPEVLNHASVALREWTATQVEPLLAASEASSETEVEGVVEEALRELKVLLVDRGKTYFENTVGALSVWDALHEQAKLEGRQLPDDIAAYIQSKVSYCLRRCIPFWETDNPRTVARGMVPVSAVTSSFDAAELARLSDQLEVAIDLDRIFQQMLGVGHISHTTQQLQKKAMPTIGRYNFQVRVARGGLPLDLLREPGRLENDFHSHRERYGQSSPVFTDRRYEFLLEGTFLIFLLAEQLKIVETPFETSGGQNTHGTHGYLGRNLGAARLSVLESLRSGGANEGIFQEIAEDVEQRLGGLARAEQKEALLRCWRRLRNAVDHRTGALREHMYDGMNLIEQELERGHGLEGVDIPNEVANLRP